MERDSVSGVSALNGVSMSERVSGSRGRGSSGWTERLKLIDAASRLTVLALTRHEIV
jgi:hypothetical protein